MARHRYFLFLAVLALVFSAAAQQHAEPAPARTSQGAATQREQAPAAQPAAAGEHAQPAAGGEHGQTPAAGGGHGQEPKPAHASEETGEHKPFGLADRIPAPVVEVLRWSNFVVLFGLLGYLLRRPAAEFFSARTQAIREGLESGRRAREDAARRLKEIEDRLAGLESEIARLRESSSAGAQAERERLRKATVAEAEKILAQAEQEIAALGKAAHSELKSYAAALAVELAETRIRARITPDRQAQLLREYAEKLSGDGQA